MNVHCYVMSVIESDSEEASRVFGFPRGVRSRELTKPWSFGFGDEKRCEAGSLDSIPPRPLARAPELRKKGMFGNREGQHISLKRLLPNFSLQLVTPQKTKGRLLLTQTKLCHTSPSGP